MLPLNIAIFTVVFNPTTLHSWIDDLNNQDDQDFDYFIIDDHSTRPDLLASAQRSHIRRPTTPNLYWGGGFLYGFELVFSNKDKSYTLAILTNADTRLPKNFISSIRSASIKAPNASIICPAVDQTGTIEYGCRYTGGLNFQPAHINAPCNCAPTRAIAIPKTQYQKISVTNIQKFPHYLSDYALTLELSNQLDGLKYNNDCHVHYNKNESSQIRAIKPLIQVSSIFSIKNPTNPIYLSKFILLYSSKRHIPFTMITIWAKAVMLVLVGRKGRP